MSGYTRTKRVTDPLDDKAKNRIVGRDWIGPDYVSSGSEHSAQADDDVMSPSLSELFFGFKIDEAGDESPESDDSDDCERDPSMYDSTESNVDSIRPILQGIERDDFRKMLAAHVSRGVSVFSCLRSSNHQIFQRNVMAYLRNCGYNAAICKTKWKSCGGLTAGNYEFIDVVRTECSTRYIVDLDFASEFEIARATSSYNRLLQQLPRIFVGAGDDLRRILKVMSDASRRSLKSRGLIYPPWRKHRFMQNKWFGPYRRTDNIFPATFSPAAKQSSPVKCRAVGFDATANGGGHLFFPAAARTR